MTDVLYTINDYHNDGHWRTDGGAFGYSTADVRLGGTSPYYEMFLRFQLTHIEPGVTLSAAALTLTPILAPSAAITVRVRALKEVDPAYPVSYADQAARPETSAFVDWTIPAHSVGQAQTSPNLSAILSELVAQPGWAAGNHVVFKLEHLSAAVLHRFGALGSSSTDPNPARLAITYSGGGTSEVSDTFETGSSPDDGYSSSTGGINNNTNTGYCGRIPDADFRRPYFRFLTAGLTGDHTVSAARLKLYPTSSRGPYTVNARVYGDSSAPSPAAISGTTDYNSRARTSAFTAFTLSSTTAGTPYGSAAGLDVTAVVAELVADGHADGAAIQFLIDIVDAPGNNYHTVSQSSATTPATYPPVLEVTWLVSGGGGGTPGDKPLGAATVSQTYTATASYQAVPVIEVSPFPTQPPPTPPLAVRWQFWLDDPRGWRVALLNEVLSADVVRAANAISQHAIDLPGDFDLSLVKKDSLVECWRGPVGQPLRLESVFFVRSVTHEQSAGSGADILTLTGPDAGDLLRRRIVAYPAASPPAAKSGPIDDLMKAIVRENLGALAAPERSLAPLGLSVDPDFSLGPVIEKRFAWRNVLAVLEDLAGAAAEAGVRLDFSLDPVVIDDSRLGFHFRVTRRELAGASPNVTFSRAAGNLEDARLVHDWADEITYVYAGGQGEEDNREISEIAAERALSASPWGRAEAFADHSNAASSNALAAAAAATLAAGAARLRFSGTLKDIPSARYGVHWHWRDPVTIHYAGLQLLAWADKVRLRLNEKGENTIEARMEIELAA